MHGREITLHRFKGPGQILFLMDLKGIEGGKALCLQEAKESGKIERAIAGGQMLVSFTLIVV